MQRVRDKFGRVPWIGGSGASWKTCPGVLHDEKYVNAFSFLKVDEPNSAD